MKIIDYPNIRQKYHQGFPRENPPTEVVIHGTGGGSSAEKLLDWMMSGERSKEYQRGVALFHALIDFNGDIYQIINNNNWVFHSSSGEHDKGTIGIECLNQYEKNEGELTPEQYGGLFGYINLLMGKYPINRIVGHDYNNQKYSHNSKGCPGPFFRWQSLCDYLSMTGYVFDTEEECIYNIHRVKLA